MVNLALTEELKRTLMERALAMGGDTSSSSESSGGEEEEGV